MRRALSISLILLFWLPALAALMPGAGEARLPFCCRRQGAHHCAMEMAAVQSDGSGASLHGPSRCPQFPALPARVSPVSTAAAAHADRRAVIASIYLPVERRESARSGLVRSQLDRGPPSSDLA